MLKVEALIKHLSENNPQNSPARMALLNYLTHLAEPEDLVTPELLESFFAICLDYAHWQQNKSQLTEEIRDLLSEHIDSSALKWPDQTQVVELEYLADLTDSLQCYLNSIYKKGEKYRLIMENDKRILAIILMPDHSICVRAFDRKMVVRHGQLEPLKKDMCLHYNSQLELDPLANHKMEIGPFVIAQFRIHDAGVEGSLVRGYLHQKFFDLQGESLAAYPKLFYSLKRIEQYFLQRQSDPFYQETVAALEKAIDQIRLNEAEGVQECMDVMARAQNALEYVFTGDKLLTLLIRDLQHTLAQKNSRVVRTPQKVEESWNLSRNLLEPTPTQTSPAPTSKQPLPRNPMPAQEPTKPSNQPSLSQRIRQMNQQMQPTQTHFVVRNPRKSDLTN